MELLGEVEELALPVVMPNRIHSWHLFPIRLKLDHCVLDRAEVISEMKKAGIGTSVHWMPLHLHPYYRHQLGCDSLEYPCATSIYPELITLPLYADLTSEDIGYVCWNLKEIIARSRVTVLGANVSNGRV
jgi:perosamine synthetase